MGLTPTQLASVSSASEMAVLLNGYHRMLADLYLVEGLK
jgi:hypothetical protein